MHRRKVPYTTEYVKDQLHLLSKDERVTIIRYIASMFCPWCGSVLCILDENVPGRCYCTVAAQKEGE